MLTPRSTPKPFAKTHASISGRIEKWQVINRDGSVAREGSCDNLILDQALDLIAEYGTPVGTNNSDSNGSVQGIQARIAVGTGSTEPAVTDTALGNEIARTNATYAGAQDAHMGNGVYERRKFFEFDFGVATGNLTEFGLSPTVSGNLATRELFRDAQGDPIVITVTSEQKLRVAYIIEITISPIYPVVHNWDLNIIDSEGNTTNKTITGECGWFHVPFASTSQPRFQYGTLRVLFLMVSGAGMGGNGLTNTWFGPRVFSEADANLVKSGTFLDPAHIPSTGEVADTGAVGISPSYVSGEHKRSLGIAVTTADWNQEHWGFSLKRAFVFTANAAADMFEKDNEQTFEAMLVEVSWARA